MTVEKLSTSRKQLISTAHMISVLYLVVFYILVGCGPTLKTVEHTTDQTQLTRIAIEAKHFVIRRAAVRKLTDQDALEKIALNDETMSVREVAARKLTDQTILEKIALSGKFSSVREVAAGKVTDQTVLAKIALSDKSYLVRRAAIRNLTDQNTLETVALYSASPGNRKIATDKLTDQTVLAKVARRRKFEKKAAGITCETEFTLSFSGKPNVRDGGCPINATREDRTFHKEVISSAISFIKKKGDSERLSIEGKSIIERKWTIEMCNVESNLKKNFKEGRCVVKISELKRAENTFSSGTFMEVRDIEF